MFDVSAYLRSSWTGNPSTKRLVVWLASLALIVVFVAIGGGSAYWIALHGDLGSGAVAALAFVGGIMAALAGVAYRKAEVGAGAPPARDEVPNNSNAPLTGRLSGGVESPVDPGTHRKVTP